MCGRFFLSFWGVPVTTQGREGIFRYKFNLGGCDQFAALSQFRIFSTKRLERKIAAISKGTYEELLTELMDLLVNLKDNNP